MSNEYESMKHFLNKVRSLKNKLNEGQDTQMTPSGERIYLNDNSKIAVFLKNDTNTQIDDQTKNELVTALDSFISETGLMMLRLDVEVKTNDLVIKTNTITEPIDLQKAEITLDTNNEDPQINFSNEMIKMDDDTTNAIRSIKSAYDNPQFGRIKLKQIAQTKI
jgi:hypothetical protein